ncbi:MAG TPA: NAD(P)-binding protein [Polyangiales bacterium]|nr:NAD(P)-binding protein [Polyangiales bacterium]
METDYLVIGAGAMGLAFADELLTRTDAHITLVDKRHAPGGHWNDAYSFVKLHQPSVFYGVESKELTEYRIDDSGPNKGFLSLAEGPEISSYFHTLVRDRFLPSGRVRFLPLSEVEPEGSVRSLLSGERTSIEVRKRVVDASYLTNIIPLTHTRNFTLADGVTCVPPNELPRWCASHARFTVVGAGKTGVDTCCFLLEHGAAPDAIRWIVPRDSWFLNRATMQPGPEFFIETFGTFAAGREALADATSARDYALRMEAARGWLRLSRDVEPRMFHGATVSEGELDELRRIRDVVRMGRVRSIDVDRVRLEAGEVPAARDTLYVDCTASALSRPTPVPIFSGKRITLQMIRYPYFTYSAALIALIEATLGSDEEKNRVVTPLHIPDTVEDYLRQQVPDMQNRVACGRHPVLREWADNARTDGFTRLMRTVKPTETDKLAVLARLREASKRAAQNLPKLLATLD